MDWLRFSFPSRVLPQYLAVLLSRRKRRFVTSLDGIATCYDAVDGHEYWKQRILGKFSASPIAANGLVYYLNENGKTYVIQPRPELKIDAENEMPGGKDEIFRASMSPSHGQLFIRSTSVLYCVGKKP